MGRLLMGNAAVPRRMRLKNQSFMAVWSPVPFLCHPHRSALLFRNWTPGNEVVVQAAGRVFASASSDPPPKPYGPVRYIQKPSPPKEQDGREERNALERRKSPGWGSIQSDSLDEGKHDGESNTFKKKGYPQTYRGEGNRRFSDKGLGKALPVVKVTRGPHSSRQNEVEEGGQDTARPKLDAGENLFGDDTCILRTHVEDVQVDEPRRQIIDKDPGTTARNYVLGLLARGPQTELNLRTKMTRRNVAPEVIDETINDLQRCGLQSDEEYAEVFAHSRWTDNTWGPKRIKYELLRKGISKETVETALVKLFQMSDTAGNEEEEDLGKWGMTTEAAEHLVVQARKRWCQGNMKIDVRKRRMIGWLQRRGFAWTIIPDILKIIESEETTEVFKSQSDES